MACSGVDCPPSAPRHFEQNKNIGQAPRRATALSERSFNIVVARIYAPAMLDLEEPPDQIARSMEMHCKAVCGG
jgi:hypothetical protein